MKYAGKLMGLCLTLVIVGSALAQDNQVLQPVPEASDSAAIELFNCVEYKDLDEMAPCAVTKIIQVNDPCACRDACNCCSRKCVYIQICVPPPCVCQSLPACCGSSPPCSCERVRSRKGGDRVRYDYGEYAVDVRVKDGYIEVDYQD